MLSDRSLIFKAATIKPGYAPGGFVDQTGEGFGLPDAGLQPEIPDRERARCPVSFRLYPADEPVAVQHRQHIIPVFPLRNRGIDFP